IHHYFPAVYFAAILFAHVVDHLGSRLLPRLLHWIVLLALIGAVTGLYFFMADFAFGITGPASAYANRKLMPTWNLY
ncbi:hypothetical protein HK405_007005, partial [Cladochytrium tenue]